MIIYLAGLKALDPSLREAAAIDGASEARTFFRVVLPALKPINIVLVVITVIEALRAFDIVYIINSGRNGLELLSVLITNNIIGEASRIGYGSAIAVVLLTISLVPIIIFVWNSFQESRVHDERCRRRSRRAAGAEAAKPKATRSRIVLHVFLILATLLWISPILWAIFTAMRPYADTSRVRLRLVAEALQLRQLHAPPGRQAEFPHYFWNSIIVAVPAIVLILLFSSAIAFVVSRLSFWCNVPLLVFFMAANLLPQQVILQPLYRLYLRIPLPTWISDSGLIYDSYLGLIRSTSRSRRASARSCSRTT